MRAGVGGGNGMDGLVAAAMGRSWFGGGSGGVLGFGADEVVAPDAVGALVEAFVDQEWGELSGARSGAFGDAGGEGVAGGGESGGVGGDSDFAAVLRSSAQCDAHRGHSVGPSDLWRAALGMDWGRCRVVPQAARSGDLGWLCATFRCGSGGLAA